MRNSILAAIAALSLLACAEEQATVPDRPDVAPATRADAAGLARDYAEFRATQVSNIAYRLHVELDPALPVYAGQNTIAFDLIDAASPVTVDFAGGDVDRVEVNGTPVDIRYNGHFLTLPAAALQAGANEAVVGFRQSWSDDGTGLYRYDDTDDGNTYVYTDFQPYDANAAFPLFDQPDLKARFTLSVTAPGDWQVISTDRELSIEATADERQHWKFPETPLMQTYIMSLHAGPYAVWNDAGFRIPLRLFARQTLAELVEPDVPMWFDYTRRGFDFFEPYYGVDYPFTKYDQVIVPDFNAGAMENAGAVTFTERSFIQRDGWSSKETRWLVEVILHEMAHMWFGNYVTMKWWNDLWLSETFAEFMAYKAAPDLDVRDAWEGFFLDRKYYAYWLDQRRTTHPIEAEINDTFEAGTTFDMISYAKGAAVLRQLEFWLGEDVFRDGISRYLRRHAYDNATLDDLVAALSEAAGTDLSSWARDWIATAGVNTIEADFTCADGEITEFALVQSAPADNPVLRTQKVQVGFFRDKDGVIVTDAVIPVLYSGERTAVPEAIGVSCPDIVYPNYGDMGYLLVRLDPRTRANIESMIGRIDDDFQRVMFWQTLWDNVRFAQIPVTVYLDAVFASAAEEDDIKNVDQVYAFVGTAIGYLREMGASGAAALAEYRPRAEALTWANVERTRGDLQTMYLDRYLAFASSPAAQAQFIDLLRGEATIPGRELDQDRRWLMVRRLSAEGHPRAADMLAAEVERDASDRGRRAALGARAAVPNLAIKRGFIADVVDRESTTAYALQRTAMASLFPAGQENLHEALAGEILAQIEANEADADPDYHFRAVGFAAYLTPTTCTPESVARLEQAMAIHADSRRAIRDIVIERWEDDVLCLERAALLN